MPRGPDLAKRIEVAERRRFAVTLRTAGATYQQIADQAVDTFGTQNLPTTWDQRYAHRDVKAVLDRMYKQMFMDIRAYQQIQVERYEGIIRTHWPKVMKGEKGAAELVLKAMKDENKLLGLDAPQRVDMRVQQVDQRLERLIAELESSPEGAVAGHLGAGGGSEEGAVVEGAARPV